MASYLKPKHYLRLRMYVCEVLAGAMEDAIDGEGSMTDEEDLPNQHCQHLSKPHVGISAAYPCQYSKPVLCTERLQQRNPAVDPQNRSNAR